MPNYVNAVDNQIYNQSPVSSQPENGIGIGYSFEQDVLAANAVSLTTNVNFNAFTIVLPTPGTWLVYGQVTFIPTTAALFTFLEGGLSPTSATLPDQSLIVSNLFTLGITTSTQPVGFSVSSKVYSVTQAQGTQTIFMVVKAGFTLGAIGVCGRIGATLKGQIYT